MRVAMRMYRDGWPYVAMAGRVEVVFLPILRGLPGYRGAMMLRFYDPLAAGDDATSGGVALIAYDRPEQLQRAMLEAEAWSTRHLADLKPQLHPSTVHAVEVLFADGRVA